MIAVAVSLVFAFSAFADHAHHAGKASRTAPAKPADGPIPTVQKMQDNLKQMRSQLDRIVVAKTDE